MEKQENLYGGGKIIGNIIYNEKIYSAKDLIQFSINIHYYKQDFEDGNIINRIEKNSFYIQKEVPINKIEEVFYYVDQYLVEEYMKLDLDDMPPVILGKPYGKFKLYPIIDGGHRITVVKRLGKGTIMAFVPFNYCSLKEQGFF